MCVAVFISYNSGDQAGDKLFLVLINWLLTPGFVSAAYTPVPVQNPSTTVSVILSIQGTLLWQEFVSPQGGVLAIKSPGIKLSISCIPVYTNIWFYISTINSNKIHQN